MITYIENGHYYLNSKSVIIPSVSDLVSFKFADTYANVPKNILNAKAEYGTSVHKAIENMLNNEPNKDLKPMIEYSVQECQRIMKDALLLPLKTEIMVDYKERYAGRLDVLTRDGLVVDFKTCASVHLQNWSYQLGYYNLALDGKEKYGYIVWLPKGKKGKLIRVDYPSKEELLKNLEEYEKNGHIN